MRISIDVGYKPNTVNVVSEFMRQFELILATNDDFEPMMPCRDDNDNGGISLVFVKTTNDEASEQGETTQEAAEETESDTTSNSNTDGDQ